MESEFAKRDQHTQKSHAKLKGEKKETLGSLRIIVHKATHLRSADINGKSDPYCVVHFHTKDSWDMHDKQTAIVKRTLDPVWEEVFDYEITNANWKGSGAEVVFKLYDHDHVGDPEDLGQCDIKIPHDFKATKSYDLPVLWEKNKKEHCLSQSLM